MTALKRILVIEADQPTRDWLRSLLGAEGFSVSIAGSVKQGHEFLSATPDFAAIICDYCLPDGTCQDLLNGFRSRPELFVPILLISGSWIQRIRSLHGTAEVEVLNKPFDGVQLLAGLDRLLRPEPTSVV